MKKNFLLLVTGLLPLIVISQDIGSVIKDIDLQLKNGKTSITKILSSDSLMYLHSLTPFREVIKANARAEKIVIVTDKEPGTRVTIKGSVVDKNGIPQKNLLVYFYQTSDKGWYSDTGAHILMNSGDINHARLFGYLKTGPQGEFSFETIKPKGYPRSDLAAHIHIHFWREDGQTLHGPGELQFEDDPRMTADRRRRSRQEGFLISKNSGTTQMPVYEYKIIAE
jgi:protocatechuate 3,4-dioxygenase beta subunit